MPMRVVFDANVLLRAALRPHGPARRLLHLIGFSGHDLVASEHILQTALAKLELPRLRGQAQVSPVVIEEFFLALTDAALLVSPAQGPPIVPGDPEDDIIVYTAVAAKADVICTWDQHLYQPEVLAFCRRRGIRICRDIDLLDDLRHD